MRYWQWPTIVLLAGIMAAGCDALKPEFDDCYDFPLQTEYVAVVSDTGGTIETYFPLIADESDIGEIQNFHFTGMRGERMAGVSNRGAIVLNVQDEWLIRSLNWYMPVDASIHSDFLYYRQWKNRDFPFRDSLILPNRRHISQARAMTVQNTGDTAGNRLFSLRSRKIDSTKFATSILLRLLPMPDDSVLYMSDYEVTSVRTDRSGEEVRMNRYYLERRLRSYNPSTGRHRTLLKLPAPEEVGELRAWDHSADGRYVVYEDKGKVYWVDVNEGEYRRIFNEQEEDQYNPKREPLISSDGEYVMVRDEYRPVRIYKPSNGETWTVLVRNDSEHGMPTFSPDRDHLYFPDKQDNTVGVWRVPVEHRNRQNFGSDESRELVTAVDTLFNIPSNFNYKLILSQPYFINQSEFVVIANYSNILGAVEYACR